jgi:hypothetical protein
MPTESSGVFDEVGVSLGFVSPQGSPWPSHRVGELGRRVRMHVHRHDKVPVRRSRSPIVSLTTARYEPFLVWWPARIRLAG